LILQGFQAFLMAGAEGIEPSAYGFGDQFTNEQFTIDNATFF